MTDTLDRLKTALAGRYAVERELGSGGMATVYLARDERLHRAVAIKVLMPELARALGPERFLREIDVAARLSHPNILPLFDSGDADGLLFYVMPLVDGESLADRILRETQLPIEDVVAIGHDVAGALAYAHAQGIVHRDIKPANILLSGSRALVADFGIARALGKADSRRLTETGFALGTPSYMSPEQCAGSATLDGRSDIYSLGCVLYEMLIGAPPFQGPSAQVIIARHSVEMAPGLRHVRGTVSNGLEDAVLKALAKLPADRFATAQQFADALTPEALAQAKPSRVVPLAAGARRRRLLGGALAAAALVVAGGALFAGSLKRKASAVPLAADRIAVLPLRTNGSPDAAGRSAVLMDLLYERLPAGEGPAAVFPGSVTEALRRTNLDPGITDLSTSDALRVAREAGAGLALLGRVNNTSDQVVVSATLLSVPDGREVARVENVSAPRDSLGALADRLAAELLARHAHEPADRMTELTGYRLPALRVYLAGQAAFARGAYRDATRFYALALARDSALAPAALGFLAAARFADTPTDSVERAAWARRGQLGAGDRAYLVALLGPRFPTAPTDSEAVSGWRHAADLMPDRADVWFLLGEAYFHAGPRLGETHALEKAGQAYRRTIELDSTFAPAILHLVEQASAAGDSAAARQLRDRYLALDSAGELAGYVRWRSALAVSDAAATSALAGPMDRLSPAALERIISVAQLDGRGLADAAAAAAALQRMSDAGALSAQTPSQIATRLRWTSLKRRELALNLGRPSEAAAITRAQGSLLNAPRDALAEVAEALFWDGDSGRAAERAAQSGARALGAPGAAPATADVHYDLCASGLWDAAHGQTASAGRAALRLRAVPNAIGTYQTGYIPVCAALLDAWVAAASRRPEAGRRIEALDSLMRQGPQAIAWIVAAANLTLARLHEARGDLPRALAAVRRRPYLAEYGSPRFLVALSTLLREEARLAALVGERDEARRAWRHYLALRSNPEPALQPDMDRARAELARLEGAAR